MDERRRECEARLDRFFSFFDGKTSRLLTQKGKEKNMKRHALFRPLFGLFTLYNTLVDVPPLFGELKRARQDRSRGCKGLKRQTD